jgi:hemoglobin
MRPTDGNPWGAADTPYAEIGGEASVRLSVETFYDRIDGESPQLRAMLPHDDSGSRQKLFEFLSGWLGGPQLYIERRGHPKMRLRHLPFSIGLEEAEEWLRCMSAAMDNCEIDGALRGYLDIRFRQMALHMVNQ